MYRNLGEFQSRLGSSREENDLLSLPEIDPSLSTELFQLTERLFQKSNHGQNMSLLIT
jgi:hypothetical protein